MTLIHPVSNPHCTPAHKPPPWTLFQALLGLVVVLWLGPDWGGKIVAVLPHGWFPWAASSPMAKQLGSWLIALGYLGWLRFQAAQSTVAPKLHREVLQPAATADGNGTHVSNPTFHFWHSLGLWPAAGNHWHLWHLLKQAKLALVAYGLILGVVFAWQYWLDPSLTLTPAAPLPLTVTSSPGWRLAAIGLGPWLEELLFRGMLQPAWQTAWGPIKGLVATALLFTVLHSTPFMAASTSWPETAAILVILLLVSLLLGLCRHVTQSLLPGCLVHSLHNAVVLGLIA
jgi:membrane protease YdiL (CAAX protease family)